MIPCEGTGSVPLTVCNHIESHMSFSAGVSPRASAQMEIQRVLFSSSYSSSPQRCPRPLGLEGQVPGTLDKVESYGVGGGRGPHARTAQPLLSLVLPIECAPLGPGSPGILAGRGCKLYASEDLPVAPTVPFPFVVSALVCTDQVP